jgi:lysophospholipase L1-like esterase
MKRISRVLAAVAAAGALLAVPTHAAWADGVGYDSSTAYVALGDSYSSGLGASGTVDTTCGQSASGYPTLWATSKGISDFTNATCAGAIMGDVLDTQIEALDADTDVVTITIGGNDIELGEQASTCLLWGDISCRQAVDDVVADLPSQAGDFDATYAAIRSAAPNADVYVLGYPHLFETTPVCFTPLIPSPTSRGLLNELVDALNDTIAARATAAGFIYVDAQASFDGHAVCSADPWINGVLSLPGPLHPNTDGYRDGYFAALAAVTG